MIVYVLGSTLGSDVNAATFIATLIGGLAGLLAVAAWARSRYRRTLGRRRDAYDRLARLGSGAQLSFFVAVLGEPPAIRRMRTKNAVDFLTPEDPEFDPSLVDDEGIPIEQEIWRPAHYTECFFIDRDYYVQTISDEEETVLAFSVTVRRRRFRPRLWIPRKLLFYERLQVLRSAHVWPRPVVSLKLGKTRLGDLDSDDPDHWAPPHFIARAGARWSSYSEFHYYGNPGHYQWYVFSSGSNAPGKSGGYIHRIGEQAGFSEWPYPERWDPEDPLAAPPPTAEPEWEDIPEAARFRRDTVITSYTVIGPSLWPVNYPSTFGPHGDEVRTLP